MRWGPVWSVVNRYDAMFMFSFMEMEDTDGIHRVAYLEGAISLRFNHSHAALWRNLL